MITIILCGKREDTSVSDALYPALATYGGAVYAGSTWFQAQEGSHPRFLVCDYPALPEIRAEKGLVFFKNSFFTEGLAHIPPEFLCMFESHSHRVAACLKRSGIQAVTCGLCAKDTLSFSSFDYNCATLSLQRSVTTLEGEVLEPHEISVELRSPRSPRQTLAVCMTLLLAGVDSSEGYLI